MLSRLLGAVCALLALGIVTSADAAPVFFDNFNSENGAFGALNYTGFTKWNVSQGTVDLIGNGFFDFYPGNGLYVDMDGSTSQNGGLTTKQTFPPGNYTLSYNLAGSARGDVNTVEVKFGSLDRVITLASNAPFSPPFTDIATISDPGGDHLSFTQIDSCSNQPPSALCHGGDNVGLILDNVQVDLSPVPEPASLALFGIGLASLRFTRRRQAARP